jgi:hypothetical protein
MYPFLFMQNTHASPVKCALHPMFLMSAVYTALIMLLSSCSPGVSLYRTDQEIGNESSTRYSIVCIIHGDGDYLYHDTSGNELEADKEALAGVKGVAEQNPHAEVFIFHQKPKQHFLLFFPLQDGEFYYYRNGQLLANESYSRNPQQSQTDPEADLYNRFHVNNQNKMVSIFMYFGHAIPEFGGTGYDASSPERSFTVQDLAEELKDFTHDSSRFDLMILSTCYGGTPYTVGTLGKYARTIIASPDNLHLSYFNLHSLERLDFSLRDRDVLSFAGSFAQQAFDRLTMDVQTAVSVSVYNVDSTKDFLKSVHSIYDQTMTTFNNATEISMPLIEHCDCAELPEYQLPTINDGVEVFYRAARFGRSKGKENHSGWECWREIKSHNNNLQKTEPVQK